MIAGKAEIQQRHVVVPIVTVVEGHADQGHTLPLGGRDQGSARRLGIAGLDPQTAVIELKKLVMIGQIPLPDGDGGGRDDPAEHLVLQSIGGEPGHVGGAGVVALGVQAVGVGEVGVGHCKALGHLVHQRHKGVHFPGHTVGHRQGGVVSAGEHQPVEQLLQGQNVPRGQVHGGALRHVVPGDGILCAQVAVLNGHHSGHNLGDAGDEPLLIGVLGVKHPAALLLDEHGGGGGGADSKGIESKNTCC